MCSCLCVCVCVISLDVICMAIPQVHQRGLDQQKEGENEMNRKTKDASQVWQMSLDMPKSACRTGIDAHPHPLWRILNVFNWPHPCSAALIVCLGSQSALKPDLQAKGAGARENTQSAEPGAGIAGAPGGLQTQRPPQRSVPQPSTVCPQ